MNHGTLCMHGRQEVDLNIGGGRDLSKPASDKQRVYGWACLASMYMIKLLEK